MRKVVAVAGVVGFMVLGTFAVAVLNPLGTAGAQGEPGTTAPTTAAPAPPEPPTTGAPAPQEPAKPDDEDKGGPGRGAGKLDQVLDGLVADGTITQAQAEAIRTRIREAAAAGHGSKGSHGHGRGKGMPGGGMAAMREAAGVIAGAIGIDEATLKQELVAGKSIADIARAHNVDPQKVIDALVAHANTKIDAAVASGKLTPERAAAFKTGLAEKIAERVNSAEHHRGPKGPRGPKGSSGPSGGTPPTTAAPTQPN